MLVLFKTLTYFFRCPRLKYTIILFIIMMLAFMKLHDQNISPLPDPFGYYGNFYSQASNQDYLYPDENGKISYEDQLFQLRASLREGPGEHGNPVNIREDEIEKSNESAYWHGYSSYVSEKIPLFRDLKDLRHPECVQKKYLKDLPKVSIIIPFFEEHHITLKRSIVSILNTAPPRLIEELILVDDGTQENKEDLEPFQSWIDQTFPAGLIKIIRIPQREGLIRAREKGAKAAKSSILIFLDCHVEPLHNWLPPLIEPIVLNYKTVTCPFIDSISKKTFEFTKQDDGARGMFDWNLNYKRRALFHEDQLKLPEPFDDPVMAGGLFAISAKWFWELGGYDMDMLIWGGEQYELSFKIWMCHGKMIDIPCSRIGHVYRSAMPYKNPNPTAFHKNLRRLIETIMEDYGKYVYKRMPHLKYVDYGDITERKEILKKLQCKSFDWFMKNIAPDVMEYYPVIEPIPYFSGSIRAAVDSNKCVKLSSDLNFNLGTCPGSNFEYTNFNELKTGNECLDAAITRDDRAAVAYRCHGGRSNQEFLVKPVKQNNSTMYKIYGQSETKCLTANIDQGFTSLIPCSDKNERQLWIIERIDSKNALEQWKNNTISFDMSKFFL